MCSGKSIDVVDIRVIFPLRLGLRLRGNQPRTFRGGHYGEAVIKKIADIADENGVAVAVHMAESPIACLAAVQTAAAMHNCLALEFHSVDVPFWGDLVTGIPKPLFEDGFIRVPEKPGLGFDELNEAVIKEHINPNIPGYFEPTDEWNREFSNDRIWS